MHDFNYNYYALLNELIHCGVTEVNARTGVQITMLEGGWSFKLDLSDQLIPVPGNRRFFPHIAAAEVAWQFMGTTDPTFILHHAPRMWEKFVEDGELKTAYGHRWRRHFGRDQLSLAMDELIENPTNRQLYISAWDPAIDGLGGRQPKNIPCPVGFSLTRTGDKVHCSLFIRSSDVFVGLPYDVMGYALMLNAITRSLELQPGTLHVTLAHPHFYEPHKDMILKSLDTEWLDDVSPLAPSYSMKDILAKPDEYVNAVRYDVKLLPLHPWHALPELIE